MSFSVSGYACLMVLVLLGVLILLQKRSTPSPSALLPTFQDLDLVRSYREMLAFLPRTLQVTALGLFLMAFIDPHLLIQKEGTNRAILATEGIAIYLVLDRSGSMAEEVVARSPLGFRSYIPKLDLLKQVTRQFIQQRPNDLIGLLAFARGAEVLSPLTLDHQLVLAQLDKLDFVKDRTLDGTSIGYAIFKTANLITATQQYARDKEGKGEPAYAIKNTVMVVVTDGLQDPNPLDRGKQLRTMGLEEAAEYAAKQGVRMYIVNVEPKIASEAYSPHRKQMQRLAEETGGKFYLVDGTQSLENIFEEIDLLETSQLSPEEIARANLSKGKQPHLYHRESFYPYLIALGMFSLLCGIFLETTLFRRAP